MTDVYPIIMNNCGNACHTGASPTGGLNMSSETAAFMNLTTKTSTETGCTEAFVVPNSATTSLLCQKVLGMNIPASCGVQMPRGKTPLSMADQQMFVSWINGGANP
jgi:hypothetical protein